MGDTYEHADVPDDTNSNGLDDTSGHDDRRQDILSANERADDVHDKRRSTRSLETDNTTTDRMTEVGPDGDVDLREHALERQRTEDVANTGFICDQCGAVFSTTAERNAHHRNMHRRSSVPDK